MTALVWPDVTAYNVALIENAASVLLGQVAELVQDAEAQERAQVPVVRETPSREAVAPSTAASDVPRGGLSREQLQALARCESGLDPYAGDPSPWRTGYFGLEAGHPVGGLSLAEQEAEVQRIYAQYGSRAWGCPI